MICNTDMHFIVSHFFFFENLNFERMVEMKEILFDEKKYNNDLLLRTVEVYQRQQPYVGSDDALTRNTAVTMSNIAILQMWMLTQN